MNGHLAVATKWFAAALAALTLAYGYGALNNRVATLELRQGDNRALIVAIAELTARVSSLEKEFERVRMALERSQTGAMIP